MHAGAAGAGQLLTTITANNRAPGARCRLLRKIGCKVGRGRQEQAYLEEDAAEDGEEHSEREGVVEHAQQAG